MNDHNITSLKSNALTKRLRYLASLSNQMHAGAHPVFYYETLARSLRDAAYAADALAAHCRGPLDDLPGFDKSESA